MFVVYRKGYEIYGVGKCIEDAVSDAANVLENGMAEAEKAVVALADEGIIGGLYVSECTERLAFALNEETDQDLVFDWNDNGLLDIVANETTDDE